MFQSFIILLSLAAFLSFINHKYIKLPGTIGMTIMAICIALPMGLLEVFNPALFHQTCGIITTIDFKTLLLDVMLSLLLFAGALHLQIKDLLMERKLIITFATLGVVFSTLVVGCLVYFTSGLIGAQIPFGYALIFGALISPTDPIAALAILNALGIKKTLKAKLLVNPFLTMVLV